MYLKQVFAIALSFNLFLFVKLTDFHDVISQKRTEAFREQLESSCETNTNCSLIAVVAADYCSRLSEELPYCQTDCKFLINRLSKLATHLEAIDATLTDLPDECSYKEKAHHAPTPNECKGVAEGCKRTKNFQVQLDLTMSPGGKITIEDSNVLYEGENQGSNATETENEVNEPLDSEPEDVVHEENYEGISCVFSDAKSLSAGEVLTTPCSGVFGEQYGGNAIQFCSSQGVLIESSALCVEPNHASFQFSVIEREPMRSEPLQGVTVSDISKHKDALKKAADVLKNVKDILSNKKLQEFLPIAENIASFLGPVGVAFQVVLFFIPSGPDKKHLEIMSSLKTLEENTELIIKKIDRLEYIIRKELQDSKLTDYVVKLKTVEESFKSYSENPTDGMKDNVYKACGVVLGSEIVEYYLNIFTSRSLYQLAKMYDFHRNEFMEQLGEVIIINSIRGMSAALKCFAMGEKVKASDIQHMANNLQPKLVTLSQKIQEAYDEVIPKYAISEQLQNDVKNLIREGGSNKEIFERIRSFLDKSYDFYKFGITVQDKETPGKGRSIETNCWACVGANIPGGVYVQNYQDKNVMVIYSNEERCNPKPAAIAYIKRKAVEYHGMIARLIRKKNTKDLVKKIWDNYGSVKSKKNADRPFNAIMAAKDLDLETTRPAPSKAIGIFYYFDYFFCYVC